MEAIQVVFEELRKKGTKGLSHYLTVIYSQTCFHRRVFFPVLREPGMVGQKQVSVFSHVETTGGMGQVNIPVGESHTVLSVMFCTCVCG